MKKIKKTFWQLSTSKLCRFKSSTKKMYRHMVHLSHEKRPKNIYIYLNCDWLSCVFKHLWNVALYPLHAGYNCVPHYKSSAQCLPERQHSHFINSENRILVSAISILSAFYKVFSWSLMCIHYGTKSHPKYFWLKNYSL